MFQGRVLGSVFQLFPFVFLSSYQQPKMLLMLLMLLTAFKSSVSIGIKGL
jgi:hypothetical protein